ncbi:FHA domain-containing protein [Massilia sp. CF038]|uniref:FHA domain-containing protein n=1 Tax=Massilia sp. CF038 TaxID=1881045 RepID=UPI0009132239|nr:FHA domain-containing protein [Massilia sp. CF038]SHG56816.1 FHA domain protein [Massilia sp. CF038]
MNAPYFIEMLARNGDVLHRHQVDALPIRLGRGYDNDFIIDDAYAAPNHAVIEAREDGALVLRDLGTKNGVIHRGRRHPTLLMTGDTEIRIGHTTLRVRGADYAVAPELLDRTRHGWEGLAPGLVGMLMIGFFAVFTVWLSDTQSFQLVRYLQALAYGMGGGLVWAGAWAFGNRLFGRHVRLGRHLFVLGCGLTAVTAFKIISSLVAYAFSLEFLTRYSSHVAILIAAGTLFHHLNTVRPHHTRRFAITSLILAILASGLTLMGNEQRTGQLADSPYMSVILQPSVRVSPDHSVDEFMGDVNALKAKLDVARTKKFRDNGDDDDD